VVVDNEAGMEHMSRLVTQDIDALYVVSDATPRGILTASRILGLIGELKLNIKNTCMVINRLREKDGPALRVMAKEKGMEDTSTVRNDEELVVADGEGKSIFQLPVNSVALADAYGIFNRMFDRDR
jgi:CO dehydrogenase maturation factor